MQLYAENIMYAKKMKLHRLYMPIHKKAMQQFEVSAPTLGQSLNFFSSKVLVNTRRRYRVAGSIDNCLNKTTKKVPQQVQPKIFYKHVNLKPSKNNIHTIYNSCQVHCNQLYSNKFSSFCNILSCIITCHICLYMANIQMSCNTCYIARYVKLRLCNTKIFFITLCLFYAKN